MLIPREAMPANRPCRKARTFAPGRLGRLPQRWQEGDRARYHACEETEPVRAGLFWPGGLAGHCRADDWGLYFCACGAVLCLTERVARGRAKREGTVLVRGDSYRYLRESGACAAPQGGGA